MVTPDELTQIQESLTTAKSIFVVLPQKLNLDKAAAGLALYLALKKNQKQVSIFSSQPITVKFSSLVGVDQIKSKIEGKNLLVSFDYVEDSIEKVSYNIENNKFNLLIQPKKGFSPLSAEKVQYHYSGDQADLILVVGASSLNDLGDLYFQNKKLFDQNKKISFDANSQSGRFGDFNWVDQETVCLSELIALLISRFNLPVDDDIASNLLRGLQSATAGFSLAKAKASTFEAAAFCLRAGAKPVGKPAPLEPMPQKVSAKKKPEPSPDWLEPKIYKGNTLV